jgi:hypothetical protein
LLEKGTVEIKYDDDFEDGEDRIQATGMGMGTIRAMGMV